MERRGNVTKTEKIKNERKQQKGKRKIGTGRKMIRTEE